MELTTSTVRSTLLSVGLILALGAGTGCASYETAIHPLVEQFQAAECRTKSSVECNKIRSQMQATYDQYHNRGKGGAFNFVYILNQ